MIQPIMNGGILQGKSLFLWEGKGEVRFSHGILPIVVIF